MALHELITDHPHYKSAVAQAAKARRKSADFSLQINRLRAQHTLKENRYRAELDAALEAGAELPEPVAPFVAPNPSIGAALLDEAVHSDEITRAALRELAPEVLPALAEESADLEERVREILRTLEPLLAKANALRASAEKLISAQRSGTGVPTVDLSALTLPQLLSLAASGQQVISTELPRQRGSFVHTVPAETDAAIDPGPPDTNPYAVVNRGLGSPLSGRR